MTTYVNVILDGVHFGNGQLNFYLILKMYIDTINKYLIVYKTIYK